MWSSVMSVGLEYLSALLQCDNEQFYRNLCPKQFLTSQELDIYTYIYDNRVKYELIPTFDDIYARHGLLLPIVNGNSTFYLEKLEERFLQNNLREGYEKVAELLTSGHPKRAFEYLQSRLSKMHVVRNANNIFDMRNVAEVLERTVHEHIANPGGRLHFGWPYLDEQFSNIYSEEVVSIAARSGMGKTFLMLYIAYNTWLKYQQPIVFISLEMSYEKIMQRLASLYLDTDVTMLDRATRDTVHTFVNMFEQLTKLKNYSAPFYLVDNPGSTYLPEVLAYIKQFKAQTCFVDGAYILKIPDFTGNRFDKASLIVQGLKEYAKFFRIPIVATWQLNREAVKIKNPKDVTIANLGLSDDIGNFSALVLAILQENPLEEHTHRDGYIIKGRGGQFGNFKLNYVISKERVNFTQHVETVYTTDADGQMLIDDGLEI